MRLAAAALIGLYPTCVWAAIQIDIDRNAIEEAASIARERSGTAAARLHARYIDHFGGPKVRRLEVVTEFRRAVLLAAERIQRGDFTWTSAGIERALAPWRGRVTIVIETVLPPMHAMVRPPKYSAALARTPDAPEVRSGSGGIQPLDQRTWPVYPRGGGPDSSMTGAIVEVDFDARALDPNGRYFLIVFEQETRLDPMTIDLSRYR